MSKELFQASLMYKAETDEYVEIEGIASTSDMDLQNEIVEQHGLDLSHVSERKLVFNDDHSKETKDIIGIVDSAKVTKEGLYVKGKLFKNNPTALAYINLLKHNGYVGYSVEGKVLERSPFNKSNIKKAKVTAVALTRNPVNNFTYAQFAKSLKADASEMLDISMDLEALQKWHASLVVEDISKSEEEVSISKKDLKVLLEKALAAGVGNSLAPSQQTGGAALTPESLDSKAKMVNRNDEPCMNSNAECPKKKKKKKKKDESEVMKALIEDSWKKYPNEDKRKIADMVADAFVDKIFKKNIKN